MSRITDVANAITQHLEYVVEKLDQGEVQEGNTLHLCIEPDGLFDKIFNAMGDTVVIKLHRQTPPLQKQEQLTQVENVVYSHPVITY